MDKTQLGILKKFQYLKGTLIIGREGIKGKNNIDRLPPDEFVDEPHIIHDLIRGFYKPAGKPYLLSYQATESDENYGKQIVWAEDKENFSIINMHPPRGEKDNRKISDVKAARFNLENGVPFGILHKIGKGQNRILGLGRIVAEKSDGVFIVEPFEFQTDFEKETTLIKKRLENSYNTDLLREVVLRRGQSYFKSRILQRTKKCEICNLNDVRLLLASHIKPWRFSSHQERMDPNNGLLLCPNHDKLFDSGLIAFDSEGKILISSKLSTETLANMQIHADVRISLTSSSRKYIKWHRDYHFQT